MPVVRLPDSLYRRLQEHAEPFVDTPANVIERLLDAYESHTTLTDSEVISDGPEAPVSPGTDADMHENARADGEVKQRQQRGSQRLPRAVKGKVKGY
jgi:hypothetical protein